MTESVENTPGKMALEIMETVHKEIVFKKPAGMARKRKKVKVLDEDSYVEQIGNIIQRDFFPDLEKIKAQNDYLDAIDRNDSVRLRELYRKYSGKRPPTDRMPSPATFETPANLRAPQTDLPDFSDNRKEREMNAEPLEKRKPLSLDQYLNSHTSEDNESFEEILGVQESRQREKYKELYAEEEGSAGKQDRLLALPTMQEQAALPRKPFNLDTWGYKNRNCLMYNPEGVDLTNEKESEINKNRHEIVYSNTRLIVNPFNEVQSKETITELAKTQSKVLDGKIGVDGKELLKPETPEIGGFSLVRTPSPSPGVLGTPLMTWGEIEGTPFRLDGSDTPLPRSKGPSFKMAEPPRRERLALALAEKVGEKNRDQKKRALDAQRKQFSTPSPRPNTSTIDRLATMSPAARKLATSHLRIPVANVSPSPRPTSSANKTPSLGVKTPGLKRVATPKLDLGIRMTEKEVSTDDLLNISLPCRKAAADFF